MHTVANMSADQREPWPYVERRLGKPVEPPFPSLGRQGQGLSSSHVPSPENPTRNARKPILSKNFSLFKFIEISLKAWSNRELGSVGNAQNPQERSLKEWSEGWSTSHLESVSESQFLLDLPAKSCVVVLSEPGGGKTWLAAHLARTLAEQALQTDPWKTGVLPPVVVFGRCRVLKGAGTAGEVLEEWNRREGHPISLEALPSWGEPTYILDGLDELPGDAEARATFIRSLRDLDGQVILTCRTAVWETELLPLFDREGQGPPLEYRLMGLDEAEQREFLEAQTLPFGVSARERMNQIRMNPSLRALAGNPLLLSLLASYGDDLPANRVGLYEKAIEVRWESLGFEKQSGNWRALTRDERLKWVQKRDRLLSALAEHLVIRTDASSTATTSANKICTLFTWYRSWSSLGHQRITSFKIRTVFTEQVFYQAGQKAALSEADLDFLLRALKVAGLLTAEGKKWYSFIHPTFQEYALARAWIFRNEDPSTCKNTELERRLTEKLKAHWLEVEFEETLALALSMAAAREVSLLGPIKAMVNQTHASRATMRTRKRGALRTALHLLTRCGRNIEPRLMKFLFSKLSYSLRRIAVAADENTPGAVLYNLLENKDVEVRNLLAWNPNSTEAVLLALTKDSDAEVRESVAKNPTATEAVLLALTKDMASEVRQSVAKNPTSTETVLLRLTKDPDREVRYKITLNPNATETVLLELLDNESFVLRSSIARHPNVTEAMLQKLMRDQNDNVRASVARVPKVTEAMLLELTEDEDFSVRYSVAAAPNASETVLLALSMKQDSLVQYRIASNPNATDAVLLELLKDENDEMRQKIVTHPHASKTVLFKLIEDKDHKNYRIRESVARASNATEAVLLKLLEDPLVGVRHSIILNPNATELLLFKLLEHNDFWIWRRVARHPKSTEAVLFKLLEIPNLEVNRGVAENPNATEAVLLKLLENEDDKVRWNVARHPNATEVLLLELLENENTEVKRSVAENPNATEAVLHKLLEDNDIGVWYCVACHPRATEAVLRKLLKNRDEQVMRSVAENPNATEAVLLKLLKNRDIQVWRNVARHPNAAEAVLLKLLQNRDDEVRWRVPLHPNITPKVLLGLFKSEPIWIRQWIALNPNMLLEDLH